MGRPLKGVDQSVFLVALNRSGVSKLARCVLLGSFGKPAWHIMLPGGLKTNVARILRPALGSVLGLAFSATVAASPPVGTSLILDQANPGTIEVRLEALDGPEFLMGVGRTTRAV